MAQRDLDAALQLLADRAQYITGSSGAAIALKRGGQNDMICRASSGANAPELGALLSTEFGLSGESVRTRQLLLCDDAERDTRVNRDVCRELGIASVAVMPVVNDDEVLGVFELFSGRAHAFGERDFLALKRLSEMVETAVKLSRAAEMTERLRPSKSAPGRPLAEKPVAEQKAKISKPPEPQSNVAEKEATAPAPVKPTVEFDIPAEVVPGSGASLNNPPAEASVLANGPTAPGRSLLWSVALEGESEVDGASAEEESHLPLTFRNLRKCDACGFPVSAGRSLCVECEEKKWRGQLKVPAKQTPVVGGQTSSPQPQTSDPGAQTSDHGPRTKDIKPQNSERSFAAAAPAMAQEKATGEKKDATMSSGISTESVATASTPTIMAEPAAKAVGTRLENSIEQAPAPELTLSGGLEPSQSWLARNKFVLIAIAVIAAVTAAFLLAR